MDLFDAINELLGTVNGRNPTILTILGGFFVILILNIFFYRYKLGSDEYDDNERCKTSNKPRKILIEDEGTIEFSRKEEANKTNEEKLQYSSHVIWLDNLEKFLPPFEISEIIEKQFNGLPEGQILFNVNKEMKVGVSEEAKAYIAKNLSQIQEQVESYYLEKIDAIKVSPKMKVSLTGDNFKIQSVTESVQSIMNGRVTTWEWSIKPLEAGTQKLTLNVYVIIEIPSYLDRDIHVITRKEEIEVKVNPKYYLGLHINTILTIVGIIVTLIVGLLELF